MRFYLSRLFAALALLMAADCDCGSPVHVDDGAVSLHADSGSDAGVVDGPGADAVVSDISSADINTTDLGSRDLEISDRVSNDRETNDRERLDRSWADSSVSDLVRQDRASASDLAPALDRSIEDSSSGVDIASSADAGIPDCTSGGLCIRLSWDSSAGDLDLHLAKDGAAWCSDGACYWARCQVGASEPIDWDGQPGPTAGDGFLYGDGRIGFGPEYLRVEQPVDGSYTLGLYFNPGTGSTTSVRFEIYADGVEVGSAQRDLAPGEFWQWGSIDISGGVVSSSAAQRLCASGAWMCQDAVDACPAL